MLRKRAATMIAAGVLLSAGLAACGNGDSDAMRVMQSNTNGTISALSNRLKTAEATITAMGTSVLRLERAQSDLATTRAQNNDLIARQNAATPIPQSGGQPSTGATPGTQNQGSGQTISATVPAGTPGSVLIEKVVTAKGVDAASGCAVGESVSFSVSDAKIWVIATVRNLKKGVVFTSNWSGGDIKKDFTWTADFASAKTCVNFYIEPKTLGVKPGDWTVNITTSDAVAGQPVNFKVQ